MSTERMPQAGATYRLKDGHSDVTWKIVHVFDDGWPLLANGSTWMAPSLYKFRREFVAVPAPVAAPREPVSVDERRMLLYWLARAYESGNREGWEAGPSVDETMRSLLDVLANYDVDPCTKAGKDLLREKHLHHVQPAPREQGVEAKVGLGTEHGRLLIGVKAADGFKVGDRVLVTLKERAK